MAYFGPRKLARQLVRGGPQTVHNYQGLGSLKPAIHCG